MGSCSSLWSPGPRPFSAKFADVFVSTSLCIRAGHLLPPLVDLSGLGLGLGECDLWKSSRSPGLLFLQAAYMGFFQAGPEKATVCSHEVQGCDPAIYLVTPAKVPETPLPHGNCSQGWPQYSHPWPALPFLKIWVPAVAWRRPHLFLSD